MVCELLLIRSSFLHITTSWLMANHFTYRGPLLRVLILVTMFGWVPVRGFLMASISVGMQSSAQAVLLRDLCKKIRRLQAFQRGWSSSDKPEREMGLALPVATRPPLLGM